MSSTKECEILKIVETTVKSGLKTIDNSLMKKLKTLCKSSNELVIFTYHTLMTQLRKDHSEIRYSSLLMINELFIRSSVFRKLLENELEEFLELVAETDPDNPLPLPQAAAKDLRLKGLEFIQSWASKFGEKCFRLELALTYLKKCRKVDFNDLSRSAAQRERDRQEQERRDRIMNERINRVKSEMLEMTGEISNTILQVENCLRLLVPHPDDFFSFEDFSQIEDPNPHPIENLESNETETNEAESQVEHDSLRHHGLHNRKKAVTIEVKDGPEIAIKINNDTQPIIDNLEDLYKELKTKYSTVKKWLTVLTKGNNCTDSLKQAIDLKQLIESKFEKYKDLKMKADISSEDEEEDDDFIEVKEKEGYEDKVVSETVIPRTLNQPSCSKSVINTSKAYEWKLKHSKDDAKDPTAAASTLSKRVTKHKEHGTIISLEPKAKKSKNKELLEKAPVLPYDIDLYHWEEEKLVVPEVVKYDLDKFWESKDDEEENEALKEKQVASLRTRKIDFSGKFEPVKWSCRAPLSNGKLCPRKDRYKCPFHGVIIKRDSTGKPVDNPESVPSTSAQKPPVPEWQDPELLRDIQAATGINLKMPEKKTRKKKECGLTNIKKINNNVRNRLSKKIIKGYKHYAKKLDETERKRFNDKFGDQWNYY